VRDRLIAALPQYHLLHADFAKAFPELDAATAGFQDLDFERTHQLLKLQEKNAPEQFEAFGQKFPVESATRWGLMLVPLYEPP